MKHSFDVEVAKEYGIEEAILMENIYFWISKNAANGQHFHDGRYWTYNSKKAFTVLFPYMTERKVRYALENLIQKGLLIVGNFNKLKLDRTKWYTLSDKALSIYDVYKVNSIEPTKWEDCIGQNCQMERTELSNVTDKIVQAIPDINTDINTDTTTMANRGRIVDESLPSGSGNEKNLLGAVVDFWNMNVRPITQYEFETLREFTQYYGYDNTLEAIKIAIENNSKKLSYVKSVAENLYNGVDFRKSKQQEQETAREKSAEELDEYRRMEERIKRGKVNG